jgi:hypothetical protein
MKFPYRHKKFISILEIFIFKRNVFEKEKLLLKMK